MLPKFPEFKQLTLDDKDDCNRVTVELNPYSDYIFTVLWCWNLKETTQVSTLNGNLVFAFDDCFIKDRFFSFIGKRNVAETSLTLLQSAKRFGLSSFLRLVPDVTASRLRENTAFNIEDDRNNFDYIYLVENLRDLPGNRYSEKRKLANRFERKFRWEALKLNLRSEEHKRAIVDLFHLWQMQKTLEDLEVKNEFTALNRLLNALPMLSLRAIGIFVGKQLIAFAIFEVIQRGYGAVYFEKADRRYDGVYQHLKRLLGAELSREGCRYVSVEQDLGIDTLRKTKLSYRPAFFLEKVSVSLANSD